MMRLYYPDLAAAEDKLIALSKEQANHVKVRRLARGDDIILFDEMDGDWIGQLETDKAVRLRRHYRSPWPVADLWLAQPLLPKERFAFVAEKATELGISVLLPVTTRYTQGGALNEARTHQHMIEAAQQCERTSIPQLKPLQTLTGMLSAWDAKRTLYVAMERVHDVPSAAKLFGVGPAAILVGPEGGFSDEEKALLKSHPQVKAFSLGVHILRSETAAIAALAVWNSVQKT